MTKRTGIIFAAILVSLFAVPYILFFIIDIDTNQNGSTSSPPAGNDQVSPVPGGPIVTVEGTILCLPHKDISGGQTAECAYGLKDDSGVYYGLRDTTSDYSLIMGVPMNIHVKATGVIESEESTIYLSTKKIHMTALEQIP